MNKPLIAVPMGDPAGIGPEIVAKALLSDEVKNTARVLVVGDRRVMEKAMEITSSPLALRAVASPSEADFDGNTLNCLDLPLLSPSDFTYGEISGLCGRAAYKAIEKAVEITVQGEADAVATTPINKQSLRAGGVDFIGHTEIFGALTGTKDPLTMFETNGLRVFFLTRHVPFAAIPGLITRERILDYAVRCLEMLKKLGVTEGEMAVAGLNPHSGESGLFGNEEVEVITPAVRELRAMGYPVTGPVSADSVFHLAAMGRFSSVLSLYHDQGHIACKTLDFEKTISVTGGMPILRTSVDHGTAFDIAGRGSASAVSMIEAIRLAAYYAPEYRR